MIAHIKGSLASLKGARPFRAKEAKLLYGPAVMHRPEGVMALWDIYTERRWALRHGFSIPGFVNGIRYLVDDPEWRKKRAEYERQPSETSLAKGGMEQQPLFPRKKRSDTWRPTEIPPGSTKELASDFLAGIGRKR